MTTNDSDPTGDEIDDEPYHEDYAVDEDPSPLDANKIIPAVDDPTKYLNHTIDSYAAQKDEYGNPIKVRGLPEPIPVTDDWMEASKATVGRPVETEMPEWKLNIHTAMRQPDTWYLIAEGAPQPIAAKASQLRHRKLRYPEGRFDFQARNLYPGNLAKAIHGLFCKYMGPDEEVPHVEPDFDWDAIAEAAKKARGE